MTQNAIDELVHELAVSQLARYNDATVHATALRRKRDQSKRNKIKESLEDLKMWLDCAISRCHFCCKYRTHSGSILPINIHYSQV